MYIDRGSVDLGPGSYAKVGGEGRLSSTWLDPCIGVTIFDEKENVAFVAHLQGILSPEDKILVGYTEMVRKEIKDLHYPKAVVRGANIWNNYKEGEIKHLESQTEIVLSAIMDLDIQEIDEKTGRVDFITKTGYDASKRELIDESRHMSR